MKCAMKECRREQKHWDIGVFALDNVPGYENRRLYFCSRGCMQAAKRAIEDIIKKTPLDSEQRR